MRAPDERRDGIAEWRANWHLVLLTLFAISYGPSFLLPYSMGLLVQPLEETFGWGRAAIQAAMLFSAGLAFVGAPLSGWMIRRIGLRRTILAGVIGMSCMLVASTTLTGSLLHLYSLYGLMAIVGAGAGAVSWNYLIADRFYKTRGLALGVGLSGAGVAAVMVPWLTALGIEQGGWRGAYLVLAGFGVLFVLPACALLLPRHRPLAPDGSDSSDSPDASANIQGMTVGGAVRSLSFWLLGLSTFCVYFAVGGMVPNLVPALTDHGLSLEAAVGVMTFFGGAIITGRIGVGLLVDRFWAPLVAACILFPAAFALFALQWPLSFGLYATAAVFVGLATGMEFDMLGYLASRYFGLADFARIYGRLYMFVAVAGGTSPLVYGAVFDRTGHYGMAFTGSAALLAVGAIGLLAMGRYPDRD